MLTKAPTVLLASALLLVCAGCGGDQPLAPTSAPATVTSTVPPSGSAPSASADGFFILVVQCQPKEKGEQRDHFAVTPVSGGASLQLRCKGQGDLRGPGPFFVRPMADTDQSYHCSPNPITLKERKQKNRVVCSKA